MMAAHDSLLAFADDIITLARIMKVLCILYDVLDCLRNMILVLTGLASMTGCEQLMQAKIRHAMVCTTCFALQSGMCSSGF